MATALKGFVNKDIKMMDTISSVFHNHKLLSIPFIMKIIADIFFNKYLMRSFTRYLNI